MTDEEAKSWYHTFVSAAYFFPLFGGVLADYAWGKYRTILGLSAVYCAGCVALSLAQTKFALLGALSLVAIGSGGIKPCVSAHVGDQFGSMNAHLIPRVFGWFYLSINAGSSISTLLTPYVLDKAGTTAAFGIPAALMAVATIAFWSGRRKFAHIPPGGQSFLRETFSAEGFRSVGRLVLLYVFVIIFWSLYDQSASAWVLQAERLDLHWLGLNWKASQAQAANPILILILIPVFTLAIFPAVDRFVRLTPLRKVGGGLFLTFLSFLIPAWLETRLAAGARPSLGWQMLAYTLLTAGEILVSVTFLEFSYTQAPKTMKSAVMSLFLLSISLGNAFTALVNYAIQDARGHSRLSGSAYYLFFAGLMLAANIGFILAARRHPERAVLQDAPA
jgi:POT family proton-dependent oligopeptide transporter